MGEKGRYFGETTVSQHHVQPGAVHVYTSAEEGGYLTSHLLQSHLVDGQTRMQHRYGPGHRFPPCTREINARKKHRNKFRPGERKRPWPINVDGTEPSEEAQDRQRSNSKRRSTTETKRQIHKFRLVIALLRTVDSLMDLVRKSRFGQLFPKAISQAPRATARKHEGTAKDARNHPRSLQKYSSNIVCKCNGHITLFFHDLHYILFATVIKFNKNSSLYKI